MRYFSDTSPRMRYLSDTSPRMRYLSGVSLTLLGMALVAVVSAPPAFAAETESSELVIITEGDVVDGDLYAVANRVIIRGIIEGDLVAVAASDIVIEGEVRGSVTVIAPEVVVSGSIGGSLRTTAPSVEISGSVGRDVVAAVGTIVVTPDGLVAGDVILWSWDARLAGVVGGGVEGSQRSLQLEGDVDGDVQVAAGTLAITGPLVVEGDLVYRSANEATGLEQAEVDGAVVRQDPVQPNIRLRALGLAGRMVVAIVLSAVALLVVWAWPEPSERAIGAVGDRPVRSFLAGGLVVFSPLILVAVGSLIYWLGPVSTAVPLLAVLLPLVIAAAGLVLLLGLVAGIPVVGWIGSRLKRDVTVAGATGLGSLVVAVVWLFPFVGWAVPLLVLPTGLGAWIRAPRPRLEDSDPTDVEPID